MFGVVGSIDSDELINFIVSHCSFFGHIAYPMYILASLLLLSSFFVAVFSGGVASFCECVGFRFFCLLSRYILWLLLLLLLLLCAVAFKLNADF